MNHDTRSPSPVKRHVDRMRVIVCGSRTWSDRDTIAERLRELADVSDHVTIVHGGCERGADLIAHEEADKLGFLVEMHKADWSLHGRAGGPIRNEKMGSLGADLCIAFKNGTSRGTRNMVRVAQRLSIPVEVISADGTDF